MRIIQTTKGPIEEVQLTRTVGVEDRPDAIALWVEWRLDGELVRRDAFRNEGGARPKTATVFTIDGEVEVSRLRRSLEVTDSDTDIAVATIWRYVDAEEVIRRDVWVITKEPSVVADAVAANIG